MFLNVFAPMGNLSTLQDYDTSSGLSMFFNPIRPIVTPQVPDF